MFGWGNLKLWEILNTSIEILLFLKFYVWIKKIKIVRVKENECKEKKKYDWCASKGNNINVTHEVAGKSGYGDIHHHTQP